MNIEEKLDMLNNKINNIEIHIADLQSAIDQGYYSNKEISLELAKIDLERARVSLKSTRDSLTNSI